MYKNYCLLAVIHHGLHHAHMYMYMYVHTYQCLDHVHSLVSHLFQELIYIERVLDSESINHGVQHDERTSTTYTSTAVYQ